jgi:hypothetical protein
VLNVPVTGHGALWRRRQAPLVPTHPKVRCGECESSVWLCGEAVASNSSTLEYCFNLFKMISNQHERP